MKEEQGSARNQANRPALTLYQFVFRFFSPLLLLDLLLFVVFDVDDDDDVTSGPLPESRGEASRDAVVASRDADVNCVALSNVTLLLSDDCY